VLDAVGAVRVSVIGHSMGGMLATRYALMYPDRVEKLVLVNPIGLEDWKRVVPYRSIDQWYEQEKKATAESARDYQRVSYYGGNWKPEYEKLIEATIGALKHPDYPKVAWVSARGVRRLRRGDRRFPALSQRLASADRRGSDGSPR
jgi:pimeloyl-ACP methyl ester carboxylesterase